MTLQTFPLFPSFPPELRHRIWTWTFPRPQPRRISYSYFSTQKPDSLPIPIALFINHESRTIAMRHFSPPTCTRRYFLDFKNDYFLISSLLDRSDEKNDEWVKGDMEKIENVVFDLWGFEDFKREFKGAAEWYTAMLPSFKVVMLRFHIIQKEVKHEHLNLGLEGPSLKEDTLAPMKVFAEKTLQEIREDKSEERVVCRVPAVEVKDCGGCEACAESRIWKRMMGRVLRMRRKNKCRDAPPRKQ